MEVPEKSPLLAAKSSMPMDEFSEQFAAVALGRKLTTKAGASTEVPMQLGPNGSVWHNPAYLFGYDSEKTYPIDIEMDAGASMRLSPDVRARVGHLTLHNSPLRFRKSTAAGFRHFVADLAP